MDDDLQLNVTLLRERVPNLTSAARTVGLRPATVSNLCTGKIPIARAEVKTLVALASLARCSLDELVIRSSQASMLETGIKVIDLFAPIVKGGTVGLIARPGMGQLVLLAEIFFRLKKRGFATVFWNPEQDIDNISDVIEYTDTFCTSLDEVYSRLTALRTDTDVILGTDRAMVLSGELFILRDRMQQAGARPVTIVLIDSLGDSVNEDVPYGPLDTLLQFDVEMAARGRWPAIDPVRSTSTLTEGVQLEAVHVKIQRQANKLLRRYKELRPLVHLQGMEKLPQTDRMQYRQGEILEEFLTQPFFVAEEFTKQPGVYLSMQQTLERVLAILEGSVDE